MKNKNSQVAELERKEAESIIKCFTRTENILVDGYPDLLPQEKWLAVCLKRLCYPENSRWLSTRYIGLKTGFSPSVLVPCKDPKHPKPGMLKRLHDAGIIHAELKIRTKSDGTKEKSPQYHITITDLWQKNFEFYYGPTCSESEHLPGESESSVLIQNTTRSESERLIGKTVLNQNTTRSESEHYPVLNQNKSKIDTSKIISSKIDSKIDSNAAADIIAGLSPEQLNLLLRERGLTIQTITPSENENHSQQSITELAAAEEIVQFTEEALSEKYPDDVRILQLQAAQEILDQRITVERYKKAYTRDSVWWRDKGLILDVDRMAEPVGKNKRMRILESLKHIDIGQNQPKKGETREKRTLREETPGFIHVPESERILWSIEEQIAYADEMDRVQAAHKKSLVPVEA